MCTEPKPILDNYLPVIAVHVVRISGAFYSLYIPPLSFFKEVPPSTCVQRVQREQRVL